MKFQSNIKIAVVIPCFKVKKHIDGVLIAIGPEVSKIYVVDDCCPEATGEYVRKNSSDSRVQVLHHEFNTGVGGAVITGYQQAVIDNMEIIVKIDGDGQMDPALLSILVLPIISGNADYAKGNRFFDIESVKKMPFVRLIGNAGLSFMSKLSTGYWNLFDPTNGYTAIHVNLLRHLSVGKISKRYFFETDILFRLNLLGAVVVDVPMCAIYGDEKSNLKISKSLFEFFYKHIINFFKRIFYNYFLRDVSIASIELITGLPLIIFGLLYGLFQWHKHSTIGIETPAGTIMLSAFTMLVGLQLVLSFLSYDISSVPKFAKHKLFYGQ